MLDEKKRKDYYASGTTLNIEKIKNDLQLNEASESDKKEMVWFFLYGVLRAPQNKYSTNEKIETLNQLRESSRENLLSPYFNLVIENKPRLLDVAIETNDNELLLNILLEKQIDIRYQNTVDGAYPLHTAIANNCTLEVIKKLYPGNIYLAKKNSYGDTPYSLAHQSKRVDLISWITEQNNLVSQGNNSNAMHRPVPHSNNQREVVGNAVTEQNNKSSKKN